MAAMTAVQQRRKNIVDRISQVVHVDEPVARALCALSENMLVRLEQNVHDHHAALLGDRHDRTRCSLCRPRSASDHAGPNSPGAGFYIARRVGGDGDGMLTLAAVVDDDGLVLCELTPTIFLLDAARDGTYLRVPEAARTLDHAEHVIELVRQISVEELERIAADRGKKR